MKLNLDFYKDDIIYDQSDKEEYNIEKTSDLSIRENIISWYPFDKNSSILEIGAGFGDITGELCRVAKRVVSIEFSKVRGEIISKKHSDKENLEVIIGNLKDINLKEKFDYITLIGVLEYAPKFYQTEESCVDLLRYVKSMLKENGKILLATSNKFAMRNWSTINTNDKNIEFDAISCNNKKKEDCQLFSKKDIEKMLDEVDLKERKYYYPLPDYKYTNVIFTNEFMPNENNLHRNMSFFKDSDIINFYENDGYLQIIKEDKNLFEFFANSYFIEIGQKLEENQIKFVSFWNNRKSKFRLKTIIQGDKVYKYPRSILAEEHIQTIKNNIDILKKNNINTLDDYDEEKITSIYTENGESYDKVVMNKYQDSGIDGVIKAINEFYENTIKKLEITDSKDNVFDYYNIEYKEEEIENLHFVKEGLWDLNFQNCFLIDGEFYIYDQEWIDYKVPIEFIIYRGILIFDELKKNIDINELYEKLNILKYKDLFNKLEKSISERIMDNEISEVRKQPVKTVRGIIMENDNLKNTNGLLENQLQQKQKEYMENQKLIKEKELEIERLNQEIGNIVNSKSWKITKPFREITKHLK